MTTRTYRINRKPMCCMLLWDQNELHSQRIKEKWFLVQKAEILFCCVFGRRNSVLILFGLWLCKRLSCAAFKTQFRNWQQHKFVRDSFFPFFFCFEIFQWFRLFIFFSYIIFRDEIFAGASNRKTFGLCVCVQR